MSRAVLVLGGAGFVGSHVVERFAREGDRVTVLDGLVPGTGGRLANLRPLLGKVELVQARVEESPMLPSLLERADVIVDAMAWTAHRLALRDPLRDLALNAASHLHVIRAIPAAGKKTVVYLGSRGQYGRAPTEVITEETPMVPVDVQGIHKLAAESHYRIAARPGTLDVVSLRFGNCFGARQPCEGEDIGLIAGFIRELSAGRTVEVYGGQRLRYVVHAPDVAEVVFRLAGATPRGFSAFNYAGSAITVQELVAALIAGLGRGQSRIEEPPEEVLRMDIGEARFSDDRLRAYLGALPETDLAAALAATAVSSSTGQV